MVWYGLVCFGNGIQHLDESMVPTSLLGGHELLFRSGGPDAEMPIGDRAATRLYPPRPQISQRGTAGLLQFALADFHGRTTLPPSVTSDQDQQRGVAVLQVGLHLQASSPAIHDLEVIKPPLLPRAILILPLRLEPLE
ncbi:MAG: hypothetical protein NNA31_07170 [Nitrospira sp.]|nr:hypothetical protein [Nitrospira sp.]